tara:strand:- start:318 stop:677 length:360 start_codon:yes stop_codon:yes gene_type:complete
MSEINATRQIGSNRGNRRVWIEGTGAFKQLEALGWTKGVTYSRETTANGFTITRDDCGKLRVAGSAGRPVFDLCGAYVTKALAGCSEVAVTVTSKTITITGKTASVLLPVIIQSLGVAA